MKAHRTRRNSAVRRVLVFFLALFVVAPTFARGQTKAADSIATSSSAAKQKARLQGLRTKLKGSASHSRTIQADLEAMRADRARLESALIATAAKSQKDESRVGDIEKELAAAQGNQAAIQASLARHRALISQVLAALQRMGRSPPPAVLVDPHDILRAIRTSMLLGSLLPEMRKKIESLNSILKDLARAHADILRQKHSLRSELSTLHQTRERLQRLIERRQAAQKIAEGALKKEKERANALAREASTLSELIAKAQENPVGLDQADAKRDEAGQDQSPATSLARLAPAVPFAQTQGLLPMPVAGIALKTYGEADGLGGAEKGVSIASRPGAVVISPADGWVAYAGPYRSYGQVLILNAGGGYYIVLAGMDRTNVEVGQFVLAGEPIGSMGGGLAKTVATLGVGATQPVLYVEFRKDGATIDPGPWWAKPEIKKARG